VAVGCFPAPRSLSRCISGASASTARADCRLRAEEEEEEEEEEESLFKEEEEEGLFKADRRMRRRRRKVYSKLT